MRIEKFIKRILPVLLAGALCLCFSACGPQEKTEPEQTGDQAEADLEIWTFYDRNVPGFYYMFIWDDIEKEYHITLDVKNYSSDEMESRLSTALVTGELPDIYLTPGGTYLDDFVEAGACAPVDEFLDTVSLEDDYAEPYKDGIHYVIPCMLNDYGVVYYDKVLLDLLDLEIPKTWEELEDMILTVQTYNAANGTKYSAISFGEKDGYEGNLIFDILFASDVANTHGSVPDPAEDGGTQDESFSEASFRATAEKIARLNELGAFSENYMEMGDEEAITDFINHRAVMLVNQSALLSHLTSNMRENFYTGIFPGTYDDNGKYHIVRLNTGVPSGLSINPSCRETSLAGAVCIEYLKRVNQENIRIGCKSMLTDTDARADQLSQRSLEMNSLIDTAAGTITAPSAALDQDHKNTVKALIKDLYGGRSDLEHFLEEMIVTVR